MAIYHRIGPDGSIVAVADDGFIRISTDGSVVSGDAAAAGGTSEVMSKVAFTLSGKTITASSFSFIAPITLTLTCHNFSSNSLSTFVKSTLIFTGNVFTIGVTLIETMAKAMLTFTTSSIFTSIKCSLTSLLFRFIGKSFIVTGDTPQLYTSWKVFVSLFNRIFTVPFNTKE